MNIRKRFDVYEKPKTSFKGQKTVTQQHMENDCNINEIMGRYLKTGILPQYPNMNPTYGDVSNLGTYENCVQKVKAAEEDFMALPAAIRKRFGHNPGKLLEFLSNEENYEEAVKLGIVEAKKEDSKPGNSQGQQAATPAAQSYT